MHSHRVDGLRVVEEGQGTPVLLVHGSAADMGTWGLQRVLQRQGLRLLRYDRRGTNSELPPGREYLSIAEHAHDAARVLEELAGEPAVVCGSSFGAVVALELARRRPELLRGGVLIEPPLPPSDDGAVLPPDLLERFDGEARERGGPAAAEFFLRFVLGDAGYERVPEALWARSLVLWPTIRQDIRTLLEHRVDYPSLRAVELRLLLLGGERSTPWYGRTLDALARALPRAVRETVPAAGHALQADAPRTFNERLLRFVAQLSAPA